MSDDEALAREMALEAVALGWLTPGELWETSQRAAAGESVSQLLRSRLDHLQLSKLRYSVTTVTPYDTDSLDGIPPASGSAPEAVAWPRAFEDRYVHERRLGRGGVGEVVATLDREVGRLVALKTLRDDMRDKPLVMKRFLVEARVTGQLEHPNIVPIYDVGFMADGAPYYTMRVFDRQSLATVLASAERADEWPLVRLLGAVVQVCRATAYAHSKGVLHGDIKPENILLGDFGQVYLADWGLNRVQPHSPVKTGRPGSAPPAASTSTPALAGRERRRSRPGGTPGYAAPEIAYGDWSRVDHRADLFSLGVVLYEILTGERPFHGDGARELMMSTVREAPVSPRELDPSCPLLLEDLCLALLAKKRDERPASADEVAQQIEAYLEGAKERERRQGEARALCARATEPLERMRKAEAEAEALKAEARSILERIEPWRPVEDKQPAWHLEDRAAAAEREAASLLAEAIDHYSKALGYDADCGEAHAGLADVYWERAQRAERERRRPAQVQYEAMVRDHDTGHYAALMSATGRIEVDSDPPGAEVTLHRFEESSRRLSPGAPRSLGATPVALDVEPGSYLAVLRHPGRAEVRYPIHIGRGEYHVGCVNLYPEAMIGEGYVHVPAGPFLMGGDPDAIDAVPRQTLDIPDFAIAVFPVTMRDLCTFLDDLDARDPAAARRRAPVDVRGSVAACVERGPDGWRPHGMIIEGEARERFPPEDGHFWRVPAHLVSWWDARAYCHWRSRREGGTVRMPTEAEWEKAARGVDGRHFPWGDHFDATFCHMRDSRSYIQQPEPVGTFPTDASPYGVRDMAGGMREWVADIFGEHDWRALAAEDEPRLDIERGDSPPRMCRSGGWSAVREWSRCASRGGHYSSFQGTGTTFRVVKLLDPAAR